MSLALATARATPGQRRLALAIATVALLAFLATAPFVRVPLLPMPAFIPTYQAAQFLIDLITAILLFDQFLRLRLLSLLVLAAGYLFSAFIIVPHTLSFPGAFAPSGLIGAREQTTAWLYVFWHGTFPLFVMGYALLRNRLEPPFTKAEARRAVVAAVAVAAGLALVFALLTTWGHDSLPIVMQDGDYSLIVKKGITPTVWLLTLLAAALLWRRGEMRVMDLWLLVAMWVWLFDIALSGILGSHRFDLGFYAGRIYGLIGAGFLLVALLIEMARLFGEAMAAIARSTVPAAPAPSTAPAMPAHIEPAPSRIDAIEAFIRQRNIDHYRSLLEAGTLSDSEQRTIQQLLSEENGGAAAGEVRA